jgi:hypothetical protein
VPEAEVVRRVAEALAVCDEGGVSLGGVREERGGGE